MTEKKLLFLDKSIPEEFINAGLMDWVCIVGDISTQNELDFVRQFGHALKAHDNQIRNATLDALKWMKPMCFGKHEAICDTRCAWVVRQRCIEVLRTLEQP